MVFGRMIYSVDNDTRWSAADLAFFDPLLWTWMHRPTDVYTADRSAAAFRTELVHGVRSVGKGLQFCGLGFTRWWRVETERLLFGTRLEERFGVGQLPERRDGLHDRINATCRDRDTLDAVWDVLVRAKRAALRDAGFERGTAKYRQSLHRGLRKAESLRDAALVFLAAPRTDTDGGASHFSPLLTAKVLELLFVVDPSTLQRADLRADIAHIRNRPAFGPGWPSHQPADGELEEFRNLHADQLRRRQGRSRKSAWRPRAERSLRRLGVSEDNTREMFEAMGLSAPREGRQKRPRLD
jgi:hypothetical protein